MHWETKKFVPLALLRYLLYRDGLVWTEPAVSPRCACVCWRLSFPFASKDPFFATTTPVVLPRIWSLRSASRQFLVLWLPVRGSQWEAPAGDQLVRGEKVRVFPPGFPCCRAVPLATVTSPLWPQVSLILGIFFFPLTSSFPLLLIPRGLNILYRSLSSSHTSVNSPFLELLPS